MEEEFIQYEQAIEFLRKERDLLDKENEKLKQKLQYVLDDYGKARGYALSFNIFKSTPCPFCYFENGVLLYPCGFHREIERLNNEISQAKGLSNS